MSQIASARLPTAWGGFRIHGFEPSNASERIRGCSIVALTLGDIEQGSPLVYLAAACRLCETFGSIHCGQHPQMQAILAAIAGHGAGLVLMSYDEVATLTDRLSATESSEVEVRTPVWFAGVLSALGVTSLTLVRDSQRHTPYLLEAGFEVNGPQSWPRESTLQREKLCLSHGMEGAP